MGHPYQQGQRSRPERLFTPVKCISSGCTRFSNMSHGLCRQCIQKIHNSRKYKRSK